MTDFEESLQDSLGESSEGFSEGFSKAYLRKAVFYKKLGQNFLTDKACARRIARCCEGEEQHGGRGLSASVIVEIGAGAGALTRALFDEGGRRVVAIESDRRWAAKLRELGESLDEGRDLQIMEADARKLDYRALVEEGGYRGKDVVIVGNLPYSVGTVILRKILDEKYNFYRVMVLMFQREVAERIAARAGDSSYGRLSVLAGLRCRVERCFDVSPRVFFPVPKVHSRVLRFIPRGYGHGGELEYCYDDYCKVKEMTGLLFRHRRKRMAGLLRKAGMEDWLEAGEEAGVDMSRRAEEVGLEEWLRWARAVSR